MSDNLNDFMRDSYIFHGEVRASLKNLDSYVGAVNAKADRNHAQVSARLDAHEDHHRRSTDNLVKEQRLEIKSVPGAAFGVVMAVLGVLIAGFAAYAALRHP